MLWSHLVKASRDWPDRMSAKLTIHHGTRSSRALDHQSRHHDQRTPIKKEITKNNTAPFRNKPNRLGAYFGTLSLGIRDTGSFDTCKRMIFFLLIRLRKIVALHRPCNRTNATEWITYPHCQLLPSSCMPIECADRKPLMLVWAVTNALSELNDCSERWDFRMRMRCEYHFRVSCLILLCWWQQFSSRRRQYRSEAFAICGEDWKIY